MCGDYWSNQDNDFLTSFLFARLSWTFSLACTEDQRLERERDWGSNTERSGGFNKIASEWSMTLQRSMDWTRCNVIWRWRWLKRSVGGPKWPKDKHKLVLFKSTQQKSHTANLLEWIWMKSPFENGRSGRAGPVRSTRPTILTGWRLCLIRRKQQANKLLVFVA